jgi:hypothetical protein
MDQIPYNFFKDRKNQRMYFDWLKKYHNIETQDDWKRVPVNGILASILKSYRGSLTSALEVLYPELKWKTWEVERLPVSYWDNMDNQRAFFRQLSKELNIERPEDWYQVRLVDVHNRKGAGLLAKYNGSLIKGKLML